MTISEDEQAETVLRRIGYYRLSGYWHPFRERDNTGKTQETFRAGTQLAHAVDLYVFDKRLRLLMLDAIERVEIGLRVDIALLLGEVDTWAHRDINNFNSYFKSVDPGTSNVRHMDWLSNLDRLSDRSREEFLKHFREKYTGPLPIWIAVELWDFGTLSTIVNGLHDTHVQRLADKYQLQRRNMLVSWLRCINFVRNVCAHHSRLWNRPLIDQPQASHLPPLLQHWQSMPYRNSRMYAAASILQYFLKFINPTSSWGSRLEMLLGEFPEAPGLTIQSSGFQNGWEQYQLWNSPSAGLPKTATATLNPD